jgi:hypothetical protein
MEQTNPQLSVLSGVPHFTERTIETRNHSNTLLMCPNESFYELNCCTLDRGYGYCTPVLIIAVGD